MKHVKKVLALFLSALFVFSCISTTACAVGFAHNFKNVKYDRKTGILSWDAYTDRDFDEYLVSVGNSHSRKTNETSINISEALAGEADQLPTEVCLTAIEGVNVVTTDNFCIAYVPDERYISKIECKFTQDYIGKTVKEYESFLESETANVSVSKVAAFKAGDNTPVADDEILKADNDYIFLVSYSETDRYTSSPCFDYFSEISVNGKKVEENYKNYTPVSGCSIIVSSKDAVKENVFAKILEGIKNFFAKIAEFFKNLFAAKPEPEKPIFN